MEEDGYCLEGDQWADFQAIALAGYLPEIRYWLGRDNWARFGLISFGDGFGNGSAESSSGVSSNTSPGGGYYRSAGGGGYSKPKEPEAKKQTVAELLLSMAKN